VKFTAGFSICFQAIASGTDDVWQGYYSVLSVQSTTPEAFEKAKSPDQTSEAWGLLMSLTGDQT
jgi:hypothetical protein